MKNILFSIIVVIISYIFASQFLYPTPSFIQTSSLCFTSPVLCTDQDKMAAAAAANPVLDLTANGYRAIVAGGTGATGRHLVRELAESKSCQKVTVLLREAKN